MLSVSDFEGMIASATVVVTHGGPGTILTASRYDRPLILVPRQHRFGEHVDDHQVRFCRRIGEAQGLPVVEDMTTLGAAIAKAESSKRGPRTVDDTSDAAVMLRQIVRDLVGRP